MGTVNARTNECNWSEQISKAKNWWGKLTDQELEQCEGNPKKLSGLVQDRYGITQEDADDQVENFFGDIRN